MLRSRGVRRNYKTSLTFHMNNGFSSVRIRILCLAKRSRSKHNNGPIHSNNALHIF